MNVLHRSHLPRLVGVSIAAALLASAISIALASSLSNISQPGDYISTPAHHAAPPTDTGRNLRTAA
jgi:Na+/H+-dicarboxylate symporter